MPNLNERLREAQEARDRYRQELEDHRAVHGWIDPEYAATLRVFVHLATASVKRGENATISSHPQSKPPAHDEWAYDQLRKERTAQRERSAAMRAKIRTRFNSGRAEEAPGAEPTRDKPVRLAAYRRASEVTRNLLPKPKASADR